LRSWIEKVGFQSSELSFWGARSLGIVKLNLMKNRGRDGDRFEVLIQNSSCPLLSQHTKMSAVLENSLRKKGLKLIPITSPTWWCPVWF